MENCPICISTNIRKDFDFPDTMLCCNDCGADFTIEGEVTFDPREEEDEPELCICGAEAETTIFGFGPICSECDEEVFGNE